MVGIGGNVEGGISLSMIVTAEASSRITDCSANSLLLSEPWPEIGKSRGVYPPTFLLPFAHCHQESPSACLYTDVCCNMTAMETCCCPPELQAQPDS